MEQPQTYLVVELFNDLHFPKLAVFSTAARRCRLGLPPGQTEFVLEARTVVIGLHNREGAETQLLPQIVVIRYAIAFEGLSVSIAAGFHRRLP